MAASRSHGHLLRNTRIHYPLVSREVAVPIREGFHHMYNLSPPCVASLFVGLLCLHMIAWWEFSSDTVQPALDTLLPP